LSIPTKVIDVRNTTQSNQSNLLKIPTTFPLKPQPPRPTPLHSQFTVAVNRKISNDSFTIAFDAAELSVNISGDDDNEDDNKFPLFISLLRKNF
jgi:hypothetical protein